MEGYKLAEVGVIPTDWGVARFGDLCSVMRGGSPRPIQDYITDSPDGINWIKIGDVGAGAKYIESTAEKIIAAGLSRSRFVREGDFLLSNSMSFGRPYILRTDGCIHDGWLVIQGYQSNFDTEFLYYYLSGRPVLAQYMRLAAGSSVLNLNKDLVSNVSVAVPSQPEQRVIAEALSDIDGLLTGLDRLIVKKRDLKQATMQQLLTGQTRLPGFQGEWETRPLQDLADIRSGGTPSTNDPAAWDGDIAWCTPTDITALAGRKYLTSTARRITPHGLQQSSAEVVPAGSVVMTSRATIGECAINTIPMATNQGFKNFVPLESVDAEFLYYLLKTQKAGFISLCGGSTFLEIGKSQLRGYGVRVPADKAEQTAIATVLSDMDAELAALEARRDKTRALKQAMMQELLTGRTRLV